MQDRDVATLHPVKEKIAPGESVTIDVDYDGPVIGRMLWVFGVSGSQPWSIHDKTLLRMKDNPREMRDHFTVTASKYPGVYSVYIAVLDVRGRVVGYSDRVKLEVVGGGETGTASDTQEATEEST